MFNYEPAGSCRPIAAQLTALLVGVLLRAVGCGTRRAQRFDPCSAPGGRVDVVVDGFMLQSYKASVPPTHPGRGHGRETGWS
jgi:hypothetical protein